MIIGIGGWERCLKTGMAAILATHPEELNMPGFQEYHIEQGFGNLHLFKTKYPWHYQSNSELVRTIKRAAEMKIKNTLFFIDEADQVFNPRNYTSKEQTDNLKGLGQHAKLGDIYVYTYQLGQPEDQLLGVDKILRSLTRVDLEMRYFDIETNSALYKLRNRLLPDLPDYEGVITHIEKYFGYWDHKEPVV